MKNFTDKLSPIRTHTHTHRGSRYILHPSLLHQWPFPWHLNLVISFLNPPSSFPLVFLYPLTPSLPIPLSLPLLVPVPHIEIADVSQTFSRPGQRTTGPGMISGQDTAFSFLFQNHYERIGRVITNHIVPNAFFISSIFPWPLFSESIAGNSRVRTFIFASGFYVWKTRGKINNTWKQAFRIAFRLMLLMYLEGRLTHCCWPVGFVRTPSTCPLHLSLPHFVPLCPVDQFLSSLKFLCTRS